MTHYRPDLSRATALTGHEVLIVVPALNEARAIDPCLRSLMAGDPRLAHATLVVADGGSRDGTQAIVTNLQAEFPNLHLIDNPERLQSAGINRAVAEAALPQHRILVRADAHAIYPPGYAMAAADRLAELGMASVVVPMDSRGQTGFARAAAWIVDTPLGSGGSAHRGGHRSGEVDHGHHAAMDLGWFRSTGGYDPGFSHNEDAELDHRLRAAGGRIWMAGDLRLDYQMRPGFRALARQYWTYGRGRARTVLKHRMRPRLRQLAPAVNLVLLLASAALILTGLMTGLGWLTALGAIWPALYAGLLLSASLWMAKRHRDPAGLWAGPALAAMHLPWGAGFLTGILKGAAR